MWKPASLDKIKPESWSAHFFCAALIAFAGPEFWGIPIVWLLIAIAAGYAWEVGYWLVQSRPSGGLEFNAGLLPINDSLRLPADTRAQLVKVTSGKAWTPVERSKTMGAPNAPFGLWDAVAEWKKRTGDYEPELMAVEYDLSFVFWRHECFNKNRPSWMDMIPFVLGAAGGFGLRLLT